MRLRYFNEFGTTSASNTNRTPFPPHSVQSRVSSAFFFATMTIVAAHGPFPLRARSCAARYSARLSNADIARVVQMLLERGRVDVARELLDAYYPITGRA